MGKKLLNLDFLCGNFREMRGCQILKYSPYILTLKRINADILEVNLEKFHFSLWLQVGLKRRIVEPVWNKAFNILVYHVYQKTNSIEQQQKAFKLG